MVKPPFVDFFGRIDPAGSHRLELPAPSLLSKPRRSAEIPLLLLKGNVLVGRDAV